MQPSAVFSFAMQARSKPSPSSASRYLQSASSSGSLTWCERSSDKRSSTTRRSELGRFWQEILRGLLLMLFAAGFAGSFLASGMWAALCLRAWPRSLGHGRDRPAPPALQRRPINDLLLPGGLAGTLGQVICTPQGMTSRSWVAPRTPPSDPRDCCGATHDRMACSSSACCRIHRLASGSAAARLPYPCAAC